MMKPLRETLKHFAGSSVKYTYYLLSLCISLFLYLLLSSLSLPLLPSSPPPPPLLLLSSPLPYLTPGTHLLRLYRDCLSTIRSEIYDERSKGERKREVEREREGEGREAEKARGRAGERVRRRRRRRIGEGLGKRLQLVCFDVFV